MVCLRVVCKYARIALYVTMDPGRLGLGMAAMRNTVCSMVEGFVNPKDAAEPFIGTALLGLMYLFGWINGFTTASGSCQGQESCSAESIMATMAYSMFQVWIFVVIGGMVIIMVEALFIRLLFENNDLEGIHISEMVSSAKHTTVGMRIVTCWMCNRNVLLSFGLAWLMTGVFSYMYLKWTQLMRGNTDASRRLTIRNVYVFNLVIVCVMLVGQLWLDWWWRQK